VSDKTTYLAAIGWGAMTWAMDGTGQTAKTSALVEVTQIMNFECMKNVPPLNVIFIQRVMPPDFASAESGYLQLTINRAAD
jgi:hypothetical protein